MAILLVFAMFCFSIGFGELFARRQKSFYFIDGRTDVVGITINDGYLITKQVKDRDLNKTGIIPLSELDYIENDENTEYQQFVKTIKDSKNELLRLE